MLFKIISSLSNAIASRVPVCQPSPLPQGCWNAPATPLKGEIGNRRKERKSDPGGKYVPTQKKIRLKFGVSIYFRFWILYDCRFPKLCLQRLLYKQHFDSATHPNKKKILADVLPCCLERNPTKRRQRSDPCLFQVQHK